jgi:hypothetical protein
VVSVTARIPLPDALGTAFSVASARQLGIGPRRLAGVDLERPFWGVRAAAGSLDDPAAVARAYSARMPGHAFFSHATAAQLWSIPLPIHLETSLPIHVSVRSGHRAPEGRGVAGHHLDIQLMDIESARGLTVTSPERTVIDLAPILDDEHLLGALDIILWRRRSTASRATRQSFRECLDRHRGRRGRSRVETLLPLTTDRSDSIPESAFRLRFVRAGFPDPVPNQNVYDTNGRFIAMPDLQFPAYRMAFDYEGDHHRTDALQWRKDLRRVPLLEDADWHHTRMSADDLAKPRALLERTARRLSERGWPG